MANRFTKKCIVVGGSTADLFPAPIMSQRAPATTDTGYEIGQVWIDQSQSPPVLYDHLGGGTWQANNLTLSTDGTFAAASDSTASSSLAIKTYVDATAIAGAPVATEVTAGIGQLATDAEAVARTASTGALALFLTPTNLDPILASPSAIGGTAAAAGTFTDLTADGTGTVSLGANAASDFTITGAFDLTLASTLGSLVVNAGEAAADAIDLNAASGGFDVDVALLASITSTRNNAQAILLESTAGGIDILASGSGGAGEDIDIICTGGSVNISGTENVADAVTIAAANGGIDITCGGAAGEDIDLSNTAGSIHLVAGEAVSDAVNIDSSGGFDLDAVGQVALTSTQNAADAIVITATAGGIDILATGAATEDIDIVNTGGSVNVTATEDAAQAIYIRTNGGTSETLDIHCDQGTGAASINVHSDVGGVTVASGLASADAININASDAAGGIDIDAGTAGIIGDTTGAVSLDAAAASNFTVTGAGIDLSLISTAGRVIVNGEEAAANAITLLSAAGGLDTNVALQMNLDSSQAAVADAIRIIASAADGGIDIDAGTGGIALDCTGAFQLSGANASNVTVTGALQDLSLISSAGRVIVNGEEAAANAITLLSAAGGIDADAALQINIASSQNAADAIRLNASAGGIDIDAAGAAGEDINVANAAGSVVLVAGEAAADSIVLSSTAGGIDILAPGAGAGLDIDIINTGGSINLTATEAASDAIVISASDAAGGITIDAGSGGINTTGADVSITGGDLILASVATQFQMNGGAATDFIGTATLVAGTITVANTNIAANDRIYITRTALNASPALGHLIYTISAGVSFTVDAYDATGAAAVTDVSSFTYVIIRQN